MSPIPRSRASRIALLLLVALAAGSRCGGGLAAPEPVVRFVTTRVPSAETGRFYEAFVEARGAHPPVAFRVVGGRLPTGVLLDGDRGRLFGWPRHPGRHRFTLEAVDGVDPAAPRDAVVAAARATFDVDVGRGPLTVIPDAVPPMAYRRAFVHRFEAAGGTPPVRFSLAAGEPPSGLRLAADGEWRGAPETAGPPRDVVVRATDDAGGVAEATFTVRVVVPPLAFLAEELPPGVVGRPYRHVLRVLPAGAGAPHRFAATGAWPAGLALDPHTGVVDGVPATPGDHAIVLEATDALAQVATRETVLRVLPGPALAGVTPAAYRPGSPQVVLSGSGFQPEMTVRFGAADPVVADVEDEHRARVVPPSSPVQSGAVAVALENPDGGASKTADAFRYPLASIAFVRAGVFGTARGRSRGLAAGDLDGDGRDDLAHAGGSGIEVLLSRPSGAAAFELKVVRSDGAFDDLRVADVDADGDLDLVAARTAATSQAIETYLGDGKGKFPASASRSSAYQRPASIHNPHTLAVGDVDGDGVPDAALTSSRGNQGMLYVFRGLGDGSFSVLHEAVDSIHETIGGLYAPTGVVLADVDGDGRDDVCLADEIPAACSLGASCPSTPAPNTHPGSREFAAWVALSAVDGRPGPWRAARTGSGAALDGSNPGLCAADLDGDGRLDLAVFGGFRDEQGMGVAFLRGTGDGLFDGAHVVPTAYNRRFGARLDADLDACDDAVVVGGDGPASEGLGHDLCLAEVWLGRAGGEVPSRGWVSGPDAMPGGSIPGANPGRVAVGDFDGDGLDDFAVLQSFHVKERFANDQGDGEVPGVCVYLNRSR